MISAAVIAIGPNYRVAILPTWSSHLSAFAFTIKDKYARTLLSRLNLVPCLARSSIIG
jgi:hypothetical protein